MFRHPNYYKELRKRNKTDQAISSRVDVATSSAQRAPGPGHKQQASSDKPQASSSKLVKPQATSFKPRG